MKRLVSLVLLCLFLFAQTIVSQTDNGCKLKFGGKPVARKAVKMRPPNQNLIKALRSSMKSHCQMI